MVKLINILNQMVCLCAIDFELFHILLILNFGFIYFMNISQLDVLSTMLLYMFFKHFHYLFFINCNLSYRWSYWIFSILYWKLLSVKEYNQVCKLRYCMLLSYIDKSEMNNEVYSDIRITKISKNTRLCLGH